MKLWPFCELFYARQPVEALCLHLQNTYQANVLLILLVCWHHAHSRNLPVSSFRAAKRITDSEQQETVMALRQARKALKVQNLENCQAISTYILKAEVLLEQSLLQQMEACTAIQSSALLIDAQTLEGYLSECAVPDAKVSADRLLGLALECAA